MIDPRALGLDKLEQQHGLPQGLLSAVAQTESNWNPKAVSSAGAAGLFQFMPKTAQAYGVNPFDPQSSAVGAARMYGDLLKQYKGDLPTALAGYNWGSGNIQRKGLANMPQETRDYIQRVTSRMGQPQQYAAASNVMSDAVVDNTPDSGLMDVEMPDGTVIEGVPVGTTKAELQAKLNKLNQPQQEAATNEEPPQQAAPEVSRGRTALEQGLQGATFGFGDEIMNRIGAGIASVATGEKYSDLLNEATGATKERMAQQMEQRPALSIGANLIGALGTGVAGAGTKAGSALTRLAGRGLLPNAGRAVNLATKAGIVGTVGAAQGALYGAGSAEEDKRLEGAGEGAVIGGLVGSAAPVAGAALSQAGQAILPKVAKESRPVVARAQEFGIPMRLDQVAPSRVRNTLQKVSQEVPFSGVDAFEETQKAAFNRALAKTIGQNADNLGADVINDFLTKSTGKFTQALGNNSVKFGKIAQGRLDKIASEASNTISDDLAEVVRKNAATLKEQIAAGTLDAKKVASIRSQLVKRVQNAQGGSKQYLSEMVDIIDTAAARNMPKASADILKQARREWRNFKTIEPLLEKLPADGMVNPTDLAQRVASSKYIKGSRLGTGKDDLVDLAKIGKLLAKKGGSDTFQKSALTLGAGGAGVGVATGGAIPAAVAAGLGIGGNRLFQAYNTAQPVIRKALQQGDDSALKALANQLGLTAPRTELITK